MAEQTHSRKVNNSLVWKLAFSQVRRTFAVCFRVDILLVLLCAISMIYYSEWQGQQAYNHQAAIVTQLEAPETENSPLAAAPVSYRLAPYSSGFRIATLEEFGLLPENSFRRVALPTGGETIQAPLDLFNGRAINYEVYLSQPGGEYLQVTVHLAHIASVCLAGFIIMFVLQIFLIVSQLWRAQREISRILRPIYDLTTVAQSMSADISVPLTSTIDALDGITENHLDRRISISDERSELQGLAIAINNMLDRLDASYQAQLRFVSDASHELRTPISIIQGYASLLERWGKDDPETLDESIQAIKSEAIGMQKLVEQLLFLARSDNQSIVLQKQDIDLSDLLADVARETEMITDHHLINYNIDSDLWVCGDPQLLKQAVRVLIDNSIKYTPQQGVITIAANRQEDMVIVSVSDTGIGMTDEEVLHVFERFWRADEARNRKSGGTGLGLSIAKWIVDSHQGYLEVISRKELGTKISIVLPAAQRPALPPPADFSTEEPGLSAEEQASA